MFLVVDGLPQRQVVDYRDQLAPDGFLRFLDRGAWFADAHYGHAFTVTGAGHAAMLTGAYPHRTGIIGNEWRDRASGETVYCTGDAAYTYLENKTPPLAGTSPRNLLVETLGDVLRRVHPAAEGHRHLRQGPWRDPAGGQDRHRLHVHGRVRHLRLEHLLHEGASGLGEGLQRGEARRPLFQGELDAAAGGSRLCTLDSRRTALVQPRREVAQGVRRRQR